MIFGSERSPGEGKGNPLWYFCLENSTERRQEGCRTWSRKDSEMTEQIAILVQSLSHLQLFATPWTAELQVSLSFSISQSCSNSCPLSQ